MTTIDILCTNATQHMTLFVRLKDDGYAPTLPDFDKTGLLIRVETAASIQTVYDYLKSTGLLDACRRKELKRLSIGAPPNPHRVKKGTQAHGNHD